MKKQTKAAKTIRFSWRESERTLQSMLKDNKLDLDSYIAKYASLNELEIVEIEERDDENDLEIWKTSVSKEEIAPSVEIALPSVEIALPSVEIELQSELLTQEPQAIKSFFSNGGRKSRDE